MVSLRAFSRMCSGDALGSLEQRAQINKYCDLEADLDSYSHESEKINLKLESMVAVLNKEKRWGDHKGCF